MSEKIQIFGATPSPYTQKMISIFRYKHIAYEAIMGNAAGRLKKMNIEPPKPVLLPTILLKDANGELTPTTDSTKDHHFGFEAAAWYWHFVDVVWLFLFAAIYIWGS